MLKIWAYDMADNLGWISVDRAILSHWTWSKEPFSKGQAWIDLLLNANHSQAKINIKGKLITVDRGQQCRSMVTLSSSWSWSRDKVKRFLDLLESDGMIRQQTSQLTTIITICNYSRFQNCKAEDKAVLKAVDGQQACSTQGTNNNDNNDNNDNKLKPISSSDDVLCVEIQKIPYAKILESYNQHCVSLSKAIEINNDRKTKIKAIWNKNKLHQEIEFFDWLFQKVETSNFLSGRSSNFKASLDWIIKPANFLKIIEGNYEN